MKKQLATTLLVIASAIFWANGMIEVEHDEWMEEFDATVKSDDGRAPLTSLGMLAKCADVAGIGVVREGVLPVLATSEAWEAFMMKNFFDKEKKIEALRSLGLPTEEFFARLNQMYENGEFDYPTPPELENKPGYFIIQVEQPFLGCVKGQEIRIEQTQLAPQKPPDELQETDPMNYLQQLGRWEDFHIDIPTNNARIVFSAEYYAYKRNSWDAGNWNFTHEQLPVKIDLYHRPDEPGPPDITPLTPPVPDNPVYFCKGRMWWHAIEKHQPLTSQFSNILDAVRINRNWTNYYELCRDGLESPFLRVRRDAETDIKNLISSSPAKQLLLMWNDSMFPEYIKYKYKLNSVILDF